MRLSINGNGFNIACGVEASFGQRGAELRASIPLEGLEIGSEEFVATGPESYRNGLSQILDHPHGAVVSGRATDRTARM